MSSTDLNSLSSMLSVYEPTSYNKAKNDPKWINAMNKELQALENNHTWDLTSLPPNKTPIDCKWIYKIKFQPNGTIERYKARLVARGDKQIKGKDYKYTFSPVARFTTIRTLIAIAAAKHWSIQQVDINNAFLHGYISEDIYMLPPQGYSKALPGQVCKLNRSLYGLKQASRQWNIELKNFLLHSLGFIQSK